MNNKKAKLKGIVQSRGDVNPLLQEPGDSVLVERGRPRLFVMLCPCGCGEQILINIDPQAGPAWRFYHSKKFGEFTIYPSIWRDTGCKSHFIIWKGKIIGFGYKSQIELDQEFIEKVLGILTFKFTSYEDVAAAIDENPWSVLWACQKLSKIGLVKSKEKDKYFAKAK